MPQKYISVSKDIIKYYYAFMTAHLVSIFTLIQSMGNVVVQVILSECWFAYYSNSTENTKISSACLQVPRKIIKVEKKCFR